MAVLLLCGETIPYNSENASQNFLLEVYPRYRIPMEGMVNKYTVDSAVLAIQGFTHNFLEPSVLPSRML